MTAPTTAPRYPWSPARPADFTHTDVIGPAFTAPIHDNDPAPSYQAPKTGPDKRHVIIAVIVVAALAAVTLTGFAISSWSRTNGKLHTATAALTKSQGETTAARSDAAKALGDKAQAQSQLASTENQLTSAQRIAVYVRDVDIQRKAACSDALDQLNQEWLAAAKNIIRGLAAPAITESYKTKLAGCLQAVPGNQTS